MVVKAGPWFGRLLSQKHIIFLFQAAWNWQLTNEVHFHRNLSQTSLCARCGCQVESVHLLFDNYWARKLWMKLLPSSKVPNFFQGDTMVWLECISNGGRNPRYWIWLFVSISFCWAIWKACNKVVIDGVLINMPEQVRQVKQTHSWLFFGFFAAYRVCFFSCCWVGVLESPRCGLVEIKCRWQCSCHFGSSWYRMIDSRAFWTMDHIFFLL